MNEQISDIQQNREQNDDIWKRPVENVVNDAPVVTEEKKDTSAKDGESSYGKTYFNRGFIASDEGIKRAYENGIKFSSQSPTEYDEKIARMDVANLSYVFGRGSARIDGKDFVRPGEKLSFVEIRKRMADAIQSGNLENVLGEDAARTIEIERSKEGGVQSLNEVYEIAKRNGYDNPSGTMIGRGIAFLMSKSNRREQAEKARPYIANEALKAKLDLMMNGDYIGEEPLSLDSEEWDEIREINRKIDIAEQWKKSVQERSAFMYEGAINPMLSRPARELVEKLRYGHTRNLITAQNYALYEQFSSLPERERSLLLPLVRHYNKPSGWFFDDATRAFIDPFKSSLQGIADFWYRLFVDDETYAAYMKANAELEDLFGAKKDDYWLIGDALVAASNFAGYGLSLGGGAMKVADGASKAARIAAKAVNMASKPIAGAAFVEGLYSDMSKNAVLEGADINSPEWLMFGQASALANLGLEKIQLGKVFGVKVNPISRAGIDLARMNLVTREGLKRTARVLGRDLVLDTAQEVGEEVAQDTLQTATESAGAGKDVGEILSDAVEAGIQTGTDPALWLSMAFASAKGTISRANKLSDIAPYLFESREEAAKAAAFISSLEKNLSEISNGNEVEGFQEGLAKYKDLIRFLYEEYGYNMDVGLSREGIFSDTASKEIKDIEEKDVADRTEEEKKKLKDYLQSKIPETAKTASSLVRLLQNKEFLKSIGISRLTGRQILSSAFDAESGIGSFKDEDGRTFLVANINGQPITFRYDEGKVDVAIDPDTKDVNLILSIINGLKRNGFLEKDFSLKDWDSLSKEDRKKFFDEAGLVVNGYFDLAREGKGNAFGTIVMTKNGKPFMVFHEYGHALVSVLKNQSENGDANASEILKLIESLYGKRKGIGEVVEGSEIDEERLSDDLAYNMMRRGGGTPNFERVSNTSSIVERAAVWFDNAMDKFSIWIAKRLSRRSAKNFADVMEKIVRTGKIEINNAVRKSIRDYNKSIKELAEKAAELRKKRGEDYDEVYKTESSQEEPQPEQTKGNNVNSDYLTTNGVLKKKDEKEEPQQSDDAQNGIDKVSDNASVSNVDTAQADTAKADTAKADIAKADTAKAVSENQKQSDENATDVNTVSNKNVSPDNKTVSGNVGAETKLGIEYNNAIDEADSSIDENESIHEEGTYKDGKRDGDFKYYDENGILRKVGTYKDGKRDGDFKYYDENGILRKVGTYKDGKRDGDFKYYDENGILRKVGTYKEDKRHGIIKHYDENGTLRSEITYKYGKRDGLHKMYNENGVLFSSVLYLNGDVYFVFSDRTFEQIVRDTWGATRKEDVDEAIKQYNAVVANFTNEDGTKKEGWLKAPNGNDTKLPEFLWVFVRTPIFKKWFGEWETDPENASKVIDENGEPAIYFHGDGEGLYIDIYDNPGIKVSQARGMYLTKNLKYAEGFKGVVRPFFVNIRNPFYGKHPGGLISQEATDWLRKNGHDSQWDKAITGHEDADQIIVLDEENYKLATGENISYGNEGINAKNTKWSVSTLIDGSILHSPIMNGLYSQAGENSHIVGSIVRGMFNRIPGARFIEREPNKYENDVRVNLRSRTIEKANALYGGDVTQVPDIAGAILVMPDNAIRSEYDNAFEMLKDIAIEEGANVVSVSTITDFDTDDKRVVGFGAVLRFANGGLGEIDIMRPESDFDESSQDGQYESSAVSDEANRSDDNPIASIADAAEVVGDAVDLVDESTRYSVSTENLVRDKILAYANTPEAKRNGWTKGQIEQIIQETETLINTIHKALSGDKNYDEWAKKEPTLRVDWRDGELKPVVTWSRGNVEYKYDASADLLCVNNEALEDILASPVMADLMIHISKFTSNDNSIEENKRGFTSEDYLRLYETLRDLGFVVPCKGCFDAAMRFKMLPSVSQKFVSEVNAEIRKRNKNPEKYDAELRKMAEEAQASENKSKAKKGEKPELKITKNGLPTSARSKAIAIRIGVSGDNLTEPVTWTQLMSSEGQTKALSDWGGIFRAWQRTGAGRPKDKLLPEPWIGEMVSRESTIIGKFGDKTPSYRDIEVNVGTSLRRNSHSEFRPILAIDEIQFMREAYLRRLCVFKYMKELDDVRLFGNLGVKHNMSFFPAFDPNGVAAGLDANGNYIAAEESVGGREFPYIGKDGKTHYDGWNGYEEARKYVSKDASLSSVIFSVPHLIKALTDVPTPSDKSGIWGSLIGFHNTGATAEQLEKQGLGKERAEKPSNEFLKEAFELYDEGVTNFEQVQNDRFGEGWVCLEGKSRGKNVYGQKIAIPELGKHYYNKAKGIHLFSGYYILDSELKGRKIENAKFAKDKLKAIHHPFVVDYNDKVREIGGLYGEKDKYAYKTAADFYIKMLKEDFGLLPRFDFEVPESVFLKMCSEANVDPAHPKLGWKGKGNAWSPIDAESYYSLFCDYGMTDPATGEWSPQRPVGTEDGKFELPENAVEIIKDAVSRYSKRRESERAKTDDAIVEYCNREIEAGKAGEKEVSDILKKHGVESRNLNNVVGGGKKYSVGTMDEMDAAYMDAVKRGDMETAARMVRDVAAKEMPNAVVAYKGKSTDTTAYNGDVYLSSSKDVAKSYVGRYSEDGSGYLMTAYVDFKNPLVIDAKGSTFDEVPTPKELIDKYGIGARLKTERLSDAILYDDSMSLEDISYFAKDAGYDGIVVNNIIDSNLWNELSYPPIATDYVAFSSSRIKSADTVTYDADGNVIPLSKRFDTTKRDVRFSVQPINNVGNDVNDDNVRHERMSESSKIEGMVDEVEKGLRYCITAERRLPYSLDSYIVGAIAHDMLNSLEADDVDERIDKYVRLIKALLRFDSDSSARGKYYELKKIAKNYIMKKGGFVESPDIVKIARECNDEVAEVKLRRILARVDKDISNIGSIAQSAWNKLLAYQIKNARGKDYSDLVAETGFDIAELLMEVPIELKQRKPIRKTNSGISEEDSEESMEDGDTEDAETGANQNAPTEEQKQNEEERVKAFRDKWLEHIRKWREDQAKRKQNAAKKRKDTGLDSEDEEDNPDKDTGENSTGNTEEESEKELREEIHAGEDYKKFWEGLKADGVGIENIAELSEFIRFWVYDWLRTKGENSESLPKEVEFESYKRTVADVLLYLSKSLIDAEDGSLVKPIRSIERRIAMIQKANTIGEAQTFVRSALRRIQAVRDRMNRDQIIKQIKDFLVEKAIGKRPKYGKNYLSIDELEKDLKRRNFGEIELEARYIYRILTWSDSQIEKARTMLMEKIQERTAAYSSADEDASDIGEKDIVAHRAMIRLNALERWGGLRRKSVSEIRHESRVIEEWISREFDRHARIWDKWTGENDRLAERIQAAAQTKNKFTAPKKKFWTRIADETVATLRQRLELIFAEHLGEGAEDIIDEIMFDLSRSYERFSVVSKSYRDEFDKLLDTCVKGTDKSVRDLLKELDEECDESLNERLITDEQKTRMTWGQVLQLYASLKQTASFADAIEANGRTGQSELIESYLSDRPELLRLVEGVRRLYASRREELSEEFQKVTGLPIYSPDPLYAPVRRFRGSPEGLDATFSAWNPFGKSFTPRVNSLLDFDLSASLLTLFKQRSEESARAIAYGVVGMKLRSVLGRAETKNAIANNHGKETLNGLIGQITDFLSNGYANAPSSRAYEKVYNAIGSVTCYAALSYNVVTSLKQMTSLFTFVGVRDGGYLEIARNILSFDKNALNELMSSDGFAARYREKSFREAFLKSLTDKKNNWVKNFYQSGMTAVQFGDFVPTMIVGTGIYKTIRDDLIKRGKDKESAISIAATKTWEIVESSQQSNRLDMLPEIARRQGFLAKSMLQFASSPLLQMSHEVHCIRMAMLAKKRGDYEEMVRWRKRAVNMVICNHVLMPAMMTAVSSLFGVFALGGEPPDEEEFKGTLVASMVAGPFSRFILFGMLADWTGETIARALGYKPNLSDNSAIPVNSTIKRSLRLLKNIYTDVYDLDFESMRDDIISAVSMYNRPFSYASTITKNAIGYDQKKERAKRKREIKKEREKNAKEQMEESEQTLKQ